jgi:hypothetical protein
MARIGNKGSKNEVKKLKTNSFKELHSNTRDVGARLIQSRDTSAVATTSAGEAWSLIYRDGECISAPLQARIGEEGLNAEEFGEEVMHYAQLQNLFVGRE